MNDNHSSEFRILLDSLLMLMSQLVTSPSNTLNVFREDSVTDTFVISQIY